MPHPSHAHRRILVAIAVAAVAAIGPRSGAVAQTPSAQPCTLLTTEQIQSLAYQATVSAGTALSYAPTGFSACRYAWGDGLDRYKLEVNIGDAAQMFGGLAPAEFKQQLQSTVVPETADAIIPDVGDAAIFKADSPAYVHAIALVKGHVLQISLDGLDARDKKGAVIALLKQAAAKF